MRIFYFIAGFVVCLGAVGEGCNGNVFGATGLTVVAVILFTAAFKGEPRVQGVTEEK